VTLTAVPRRYLVRLGVGSAGATLFLVVALVEGARRPGYDSLQQSVSALALGPDGWIQRASFVLLAVLLLTTVGVWRTVLSGGLGERAFPALTVTSSLGLVLLALATQDPAPGYDPAGAGIHPTACGVVHILAAAVVMGASIGGLVVMARRFSRALRWRSWAWFSLTAAGLVVVCATVYGVWSTRERGLAGVFERIAIALPAAWGWALVVRLWRGTPFMLVGA
jgi:Protein of unknown function (DUF998)